MVFFLWLQGSETCLAIFLPALVMGNFMVLNLFLALLLNSFNSEELKSRQDDLEDESRILQLFVRLRVRNFVIYMQYAFLILSISDQASFLYESSSEYMFST